MSLSPAVAVFRGPRAPGGAALAGGEFWLGHETARHDAVQRDPTAVDESRENRRGTEERTRKGERDGGETEGGRERGRDGERTSERRRGRDRESTMVGGRNKSARPLYDRFPTSGRPFLEFLLSPPGVRSRAFAHYPRRRGPSCNVHARRKPKLRVSRSEQRDGQAREPIRPMGGAGRKKERQT